MHRMFVIRGASRPLVKNREGRITGAGNSSLMCEPECRQCEEEDFCRKSKNRNLYKAGKSAAIELNLYGVFLCFCFLGGRNEEYFEKMDILYPCAFGFA